LLIIQEAFTKQTTGGSHYCPKAANVDNPDIGAYEYGGTDWNVYI